MSDRPSDFSVGVFTFTETYSGVSRDDDNLFVEDAHDNFVRLKHGHHTFLVDVERLRIAVDAVRRVKHGKEDE